MLELNFILILLIYKLNLIISIIYFVIFNLISNLKLKILNFLL